MNRFETHRTIIYINIVTIHETQNGRLRIIVFSSLTTFSDKFQRRVSNCRQSIIRHFELWLSHVHFRRQVPSLTLLRLYLSRHHMTVGLCLLASASIVCLVDPSCFVSRRNQYNLCHAWCSWSRLIDRFAVLPTPCPIVLSKTRQGGWEVGQYYLSKTKITRFFF